MDKQFLNIDANKWREECYKRHGYPEDLLPVPVEEFIHDTDYCIVSSDTFEKDFDLDYYSVTVNSLKPSCLRRFYLTMAYWYVLMGEERTEENDKRAHDFAIRFLLPPNAFENYVEKYPEAGIIDIYMTLDVPAYMIEYVYGATAAYETIWNSRDVVFMGTTMGTTSEKAPEESTNDE